VGLVTAVIVASALLALMFVPYPSASNEIQVSPGSSATTAITIPQVGWVAVHFSHPSGMAMHYWMDGLGG